MVTFVRVASLVDLPPGGRLRLRSGEFEVTLFRVEGRVRAISYWCPHDGGPLGDGPVRGTELTCPQHKWTFDLKDGSTMRDPRVRARTFPVRIEGDAIWLGLPG